MPFMMTEKEASPRVLNPFNLGDLRLPNCRRLAQILRPVGTKLKVLL
jgi:hypothetical protein